MADLHHPPFQRGETFGAATTSDGPDLEGREFWFEDIDYDNTTSAAKPRRSNREVLCRVVRNRSGIALVPRQLVQYSTTPNEWGRRVTGYARVGAGNVAGVVDEYVPSAGVANEDLFYIVRYGPAECRTGTTGVTLSVGDRLVCITAANSTATNATQGNAGHCSTPDYTGATQTLAENIMNVIGRAMSTTTDSASQAVLVDMRVDAI